MASLRAYLTAFMVRQQVRRRIGRISDIHQLREIFNTAYLPAPAGVRFTPDMVGGIPGEWAESHGPASAAMLYLHGGGFIGCSPRTHRPITGWFARNGFRVFVPDYRLAPEYKFPAAIEDAVACWQALCSTVPHPAVVAGDSAGGNLSLTMMLSLRERGIDLPVAAALFSPATDLAGTGESHRTNAQRDDMFSGHGMEELVTAYLGDIDPRTPLASPLYADLTGLPPLLMHVGEREILRDDSVRLAERAREAGVTVELAVWPVVPHVWQLANATLPEARRSLQDAAAFLHRAAASRM